MVHFSAYLISFPLFLLISLSLFHTPVFLVSFSYFSLCFSCFFLVLFYFVSLFATLSLAMHRVCYCYALRGKILLRDAVAIHISVSYQRLWPQSSSLCNMKHRQVRWVGWKSISGNNRSAMWRKHTLWHLHYMLRFPYIRHVCKSGISKQATHKTRGDSTQIMRHFSSKRVGDIYV